MIQITTPGLYRTADLPMADYLADPCPVPSLSASTASTLLMRSPYHAWYEHPKLGGHSRAASGIADVGSAAHDILLGGEGKLAIIDAEDWRTKAAKEARDAARADGLTPILASQYAEAKIMAMDAHDFLDHSAIVGVLSSGESESTVIAHVDGIWLRTRPDWINWDQRVMLHYKTSSASANPRSFIRGVFRGMGYDTMLAFYRGVFESSGLESAAQDFQHLILVQEQQEPYQCSLIGMDPADWAIADSRAARAINIWRECLNTGRWPSYSSQIHYSTPTPWQLAQAEEDAMADGAES
jgi:hypothetical protein